MREEEIYEKERKYLRFINLLIILNIFMVIVVVLIYLHKKAPQTTTGRQAVGIMLPDFRIRPVTDINDAKRRTMEYVQSLGLRDLALKRVIAFKNYYYVYVKEAETGRTAFALKLIKLGEFSLKKFPSMYPQMMWNNKYSHRAKRDDVNIEKMTMSSTTAKFIAIEVVNQLGESYSVSKNFDVYYGFYEFIVFKNKVAVGEISINGDSGKVFFKMYTSPPLEFNEYI